MDNINLQEPNEFIQSSSKNIWITAVSVVITTLVVGGGVFAWQSSVQKTSEKELQSQITELENKISQIETKQVGINEDEDDQVFCTMDAKECPDGSFVGRVAPNCEFAECPVADECLKGGKVWFEIKEMGIKFPVDEDLKDELVYRVEFSGTSMFGRVSTRRITALDAGCSVEGNRYGLFSINKHPSESLNGEFAPRMQIIRILDDYSFVSYSSRLDVCSDKPDVQDLVSNTMKKLGFRSIDGESSTTLDCLESL